MKNALIVLVFIGALAGIAYFATLPANQWPADTTQPEVTTEESSAGEEKVIAEETSSYKIDIEYLKSGNATVDAQIDARVQSAVNALKDDAANADPELLTRPYTLSGEQSDFYINNSVISQRINLYQDTGGAHGLPIVLTFNFDAVTGEEITLDRALAMIGKSLDEVASAARAQLIQEFGEESIFMDGVEAKPDNYATFVVSPQNVTFIFQAYQVVAYAAGMPEVKFAIINQ
jgi:hypothetical protein